MSLENYKKRMKRSGDNVGDAFRNNTVAFIEANFKSSPTYRVMEVTSFKYPNLTSIDARVVEVERLGTLREIILRPNHSLDIGTYVKFDDATWLLFDKYGVTSGTSTKLLAIRCNQLIKWFNKDGSLKVYDCNASATDLGSKSKQSKNEIEWNKYDVRLSLGQLIISLELNPDTKSIKLNDRFIFGRNVYEVTGIDDITLVDSTGYGVIQLTVKITTQREQDNFETGVAQNIYQVDDVTPVAPEDEGMLW